MHSHHNDYKELIINNKNWAAEKLNLDPDYFSDLAKGQHPDYFVISCSDSRVQLTTTTHSEPGEMFIHRNIANQVNITDMNMMSGLEYAVEGLGIHHIIVSGHYRCGGIRAAIEGVDHEIVESWISPILTTFYLNRDELLAIENEEKRLDRLSELNVIDQVKNILKTPIMRRKYRENDMPLVHGWMFDIYTGLIKDLDLPLDNWYKENLLTEGLLNELKSFKKFNDKF